MRSRLIYDEGQDDVRKKDYEGREGYIKVGVRPHKNLLMSFHRSYRLRFSNMSSDRVL